MAYLQRIFGTLSKIFVHILRKFLRMRSKKKLFFLVLGVSFISLFFHVIDLDTCQKYYYSNIYNAKRKITPKVEMIASQLSNVKFVSSHGKINASRRFSSETQKKQIRHAQNNTAKKNKTIVKIHQDPVFGCESWANLYTRYKSVPSLNIPSKDFFQNGRVVKDVNCRLLFEADSSEHNRTHDKMSKWTDEKFTQEMFSKKTKNCTSYIKQMGYINSSLTEEEEGFPIAYSILVYTNIRQFEILLRAIYRPQNVYCIHCDYNSPDHLHIALAKLAKCFPNVFISSSKYNVRWGTITVLLPELQCMKDLWKHKKWKYFINLTGQEFPLRTNYELVQILKILNGSNNMANTVKRAERGRWKFLNKPPHNILLTKGSAHVVVSRAYVKFVLFNQIAQDFLNWVWWAEIPDEMFFSSLNANPQLKVPGSYKGPPETDCDEFPSLSRFKNWGLKSQLLYTYYPCYGQRIRQICIFGIGDLPMLASRHEMFANKFFRAYQPYTLQCMDELIFNRTRDEYFQILKFNTSKYESLPFIKNTV